MKMVKKVEMNRFLNEANLTQSNHFLKLTKIKVQYFLYPENNENAQRY